jgi:putative ABC transport system permease protein
MVMATIAVGVFAVGFVSASFVLILVDMDADYQSANPHAAIIITMPFEQDLIHPLEHVPGVGDVEGRSGTTARLLLGDKKLLININAIPPINEIKIDKIRPSEPGVDLQLGEKEIFLEGSARANLRVKPGEVVNIELFDGRSRQLRVAGWVHDVTGFPFVFSQQVGGFVTPETLEWLDGTTGFNQVYLTVAEKKTDEDHVNAVAADVADKIEKGGRQVYGTFVYQPGRHFASDITRALGVMMGVLGAMAVVLSAFLVLNTINALISQQIRQIGVMKSLGASTAQLVGIYLVLVLIYGLLALIVSVPLASYAAYVIAAGIGQYLNFNLGPFRFVPNVLLLQAVVALIVPVAAALIPVWMGTRMSIREAITSYGLSGGRFGKGRIDRLVESVRALPRPLLISLRNTFRRKGRLYLTLSTLILAGAIFIAVFNLRAAMSVAIKQTFGYILTDVNLGLDKPYRIQKIEPLAMSVPGVVGVEGWGSVIGEVLTKDGTTATQVFILAPPAKSKLIDPTLTSGRWLRPEDENALVIGNHLLAVRPELKVGDQVTLDLNNIQSTWTIVGIYRMAGNVSPPILYANKEYLLRTLGEVNAVSDLRVTTAQHDFLTQQRVGRQLEGVFNRAGIQVTVVTTGFEQIARNASSTDILVYFLLVMAVLIALVGGLGLLSTMSMNVIERIREIGVMRAIGASDGAIMFMVIVEGVLIGLISWVIGALLAVPIGIGLTTVVGIAFLRSPLDFVFSWDGFLVWLVIVAVLSSLASFLPARNAARLTVREVLVYD